MLNVGNNAKTYKSDSLNEFLTGVLYLAPHKIAGPNVCPWARDCIEGCLNTAGRGAMGSVQRARANKTERYFADRAGFIADLHKAIGALDRRAQRAGVKPAVRLNGTSDLNWLDTVNAFPGIQFYDYTKRPVHTWGPLPENYHLTFSHQPSRLSATLDALKAGVNVATVFGSALPGSYFGFPVIDGDKHDLRFTDPSVVVVGLKAKARARGTEFAV